MIAKEVTGRGLKGADRYITLKPGAALVCTNLGGDTPQERAIEWRALRSARPQLTRVAAHLILSHAPNDRVLSAQEWERSVRIALVEKGAADAAFLAYRHPPDADHDHDHVHILYCRVRPCGAVISDSLSYRKNELAARAIERELKLKPPTPRPAARRDGDRQAVDKANRRATRRGTPLARPADLHARLLPALKTATTQAELFSLLLAAGVEAQASGGGWKLRAAGAEEWLKGTTINRNLSWLKVEQLLNKNAALAAQNRARPVAAHPLETPMELVPTAAPHAAPEPPPAPKIAPAVAPTAPVPEALQRELQGMETLELHNLQRFSLQLPMPAASTDLLRRLADLVRRFLALLSAAFRSKGQAAPDEPAGRQIIASAVAQELDRRAAESPRIGPAVVREIDHVDTELARSETAAKGVPSDAFLAKKAQVTAASNLQLDDLERQAAEAAKALKLVEAAAPAPGLISRLGGAVKRHEEALQEAKSRQKQAAAALAAARQQVPDEVGSSLRQLRDEVAVLRADVEYWRARAHRLDRELLASRAADAAAQARKIPADAADQDEPQNQSFERQSPRRG